MKKYVHISSLIPAEISINGTKMQSSKVDIMTTKDFYMAFFPTTQTGQFSPVATSFYNAENVTKIPFACGHYDIIYDPPMRPTNSGKTILNKKYGNTIFSVVNYNKSFLNITNTKLNHTSCLPLLSSVNFKTTSDLVVITGDNNGDTKYLMLYSLKKNKVLLENTFKHVELSKTHIKALKDASTISGYYVVLDYDVADGKLTTSVVYDKQLNDISAPDLIPLAFLESVKYDDLTTAKKYLALPDITSDKIRGYFGEIAEIHFDKYTPYCYTIKNDKGYFSYRFYITDGKITEIEENNLI